MSCRWGYSSSSQGVWGKSTSIDRSYIEDLETRRIDFDDLLVQIKIKQGDNELAEALKLYEKNIIRIFSKCNGTWYTSSAHWEDGPRPTEPYMIIRLEDFKHKLKHNFTIEVSTQSYRYNWIVFNEGWSEEIKDNLLSGSPLKLVKKQGKWSILDVDLDENWFIRRGGLLFGYTIFGREKSRNAPNNTPVIAPNCGLIAQSR